MKRVNGCSAFDYDAIFIGGGGAGHMGTIYILKGRASRK